MDTAEEIRARRRETPFRPLRVVATEGRCYDLLIPDLFLVSRFDLHIGFAAPESPTIYERVTRVALADIVALEDLPVTTPYP